MAMSYAAVLKSTRMQAVISAIDVAATAGILQIWSGDSTGILLASLLLNKPSFTESGGVITLAGVPKTATAAADGTAAVAMIKDGNGNVVVDELSVGIAGYIFDTPNIVIDTLSIVSGQTVTLSGGTITHA
jgi:hypothetical protein